MHVEVPGVAGHQLSGFDAHGQFAVAAVFVEAAELDPRRGRIVGVDLITAHDLAAEGPAVAVDPHQSTVFLVHEGDETAGDVGLHAKHLRVGTPQQGAVLHPAHLGRRQRRKPIVLRPRPADRQVQAARARVDGQCHRFGRRPDDRPEGGRQGDADTAAGGEDMGIVVQPHLDPIAPAGFQGGDGFVIVAVGEVERPVADLRRGAVRQDLHQANDDQRVRPVGREVQMHQRRAEDGQVLGERLGVEAQR